jgi:hypothetical protein
MIHVRIISQVCTVIANLSCFQEGAYCGGIKVFNSNPPRLQSMMHQKGNVK